MSTLETIQPYVEQLFDDAEVHRHLARARANLQGARSRASRAKSKKQVAADRQLWQRLGRGLSATLDAAVVLRDAPQRRRSARGRWLLVFAAAGTAAFLAANEPARTRLLELAGRHEGSAT
jgi:hypothetical protein